MSDIIWKNLRGVWIFARINDREYRGVCARALQNERDGKPPEGAIVALALNEAERAQLERAGVKPDGSLLEGSIGYGGSPLPPGVSSFGELPGAWDKLAQEEKDRRS